MKVFDYENYKEFINDWIASRPKKGRGVLLEISKELKIHSTMASHIFRGNKDLTLEQACDLTEFLILGDLESEYFLLLVQLSRAGTYKLRTLLLKELASKKEKALELINRVPRKEKLNDSDKAIFYSNWYYSAIRLITSIDGHQDEEKICEYFHGLSNNKVKEVLTFLVERGLCVLTRDGYRMGPSITHLEASSPLVSQHHKNWRLKAMEKLGNLSNRELMFSGPLTISIKDTEKVRELLVQFLENLNNIVSESEAEQLCCLNIDWVII